MTASLVETLRAIKETIGTPEKWTKGCYARDSSGEPTSIRFASAVSFCIRGAVCRVNGPFEVAADNLIWETLRPQLPYLNNFAGVATWQDNPERKHPEVMELLDKAIEVAVSKEK